MKIYKYGIVVLCFISNCAIYGQMTNLGDLVITNNTQMSVMDNFENTATASLINDGEFFVYANFRNDGLFSYFNEGYNSLTRFEGNTTQQLSGSQLSEFNNVWFNNSSSLNAFELYGDISIVNEANFAHGVINSDDYGGSVTFENQGNHKNANNESHIKGIVQKKGNTVFVFPVGNGTSFRALSITAPATLDDLINGTYLVENSNTLYPHNQKTAVIEVIDEAEYWMLNQEQGNSNIVLSLSWDNEVTPSEITSGNAAAIHIVRWDAQQGFWVDEGGIVDEMNQTVTTIAEISGYGVFTLARVNEDFLLAGNVAVYNGITPNGDGNNDFFFIDGIENYPNNSVQIFNRWGVKVYETTGYDNIDNVFKGTSNGRITLNEKDQLPTGTYFYVINYTIENDSPDQILKKAGYLHINKD